MIDLDAFFPEINSKAPGCPAPAAYLAIRQACDELCTRLGVWRYETDGVINNLGEVDYMIPDQAVLVDFESIQFNDCDLTSQDTQWLDRYMRGWRRGAIDGIPKYYAQLHPNQLIVTPIETGILSITCILKPSMDADVVPQFLFDQYHEIIAWGALGRLLQTPDQPFTDVQMGMGYSLAFDQKMAGLGWKAIEGQQRARPRQRGQYM